MKSVDVFKPGDFLNATVATDAQLAEHANRLLAERGVRVYVHDSSDRVLASNDVKYYSEWHSTALLIGDGPIKRDTHESLLRDLVREWEAGKVYAPTDKYALLDRARKLLDRNEK